MQPHLRKIPVKYNESLIVRHDRLPCFNDDWHYHSELELVYILKGSGTRFVGDNISDFQTGDLVLLGANLPHVWRSHEEELVEIKENRVEAIVIHFNHEFAVEGFWALPEMNGIQALFNVAPRGLQFKVSEFDELSQKLMLLPEKKGFERFIIFLDILQMLGALSDFRTLSSIPFADHYKKHHSDRINAVYDFVLNNFTREMKLEEVARLANLNESAFCRFFKAQTRKSFTQFVNEVRIGYAARLLLDKPATIAEVCYRSGFNNISYFCRKFKNIVGHTPSAYLQKYADIK